MTPEANFIEKNQEEPKVKLDDLRNKIRSGSGKEYWKSFEEIAETKEFQEAVQNEFPQDSSVWERSTTRRKFLQLMGSMLAMAGLAGCTRQPKEKIVPYVKSPEEIVPGKPLYFATAAPMAGFARGILVESHMGRPTKIEGNPEHPDSLGACDKITQASVLDLYDPDRSQSVTRNGVISTWDAFMAAMENRMSLQKSKQGAGLRILTNTVISPTLANQLASLIKKYPKAKWHQYSPVNRDHSRQGAINAFGQDVQMNYKVDQANVILTIDSDFLNEGVGSIRYAREFASRRKARNGKILSGTMNRLYSVESIPSVTGSMADHRLPMRSIDVQAFLIALAAKLGLKIKGQAESLDASTQHWIDVVAKDLAKHPGKTLVVVGENQPAAIHTLGHLINHALRNFDKTIEFSSPIEMFSVDQAASIEELADDLDSGLVDDLIVLGGNPLYNLPADIGFFEKMDKAEFRVHLGMHQDETSKYCHWHIPEAHYLESWSDVRGLGGLVSIVQPVIQPLYGGKTPSEVVSVLLGRGGESSYDAVQGFWKSKLVDGIFKSRWDRALHDGLIKGTAAKKLSVELKKDLRLSFAPVAKKDQIEINFKPDPNIGDGSYANNGWLQELPKPITRLTWDNAVLVAPSTAEKFHLTNGDEVELRLGSRMVSGSTWIVPGHAKNSITVHLGYGRKQGGKTMKGQGFNAYHIQRKDFPSIDTGAKLVKTGKKVHLASTQDHHTMADRHLVREATLDDFKHHPDFAQHVIHEPKPTDTLYKPEEHLKADNQWGMSIDLNTCIGCDACTVACQSENNIPIVGKDEVANGREMHWIRVDRYFKGDLDAPETSHQPVPCMHCENAPCEPVCPVGATVHSSEGLNDMVYNRCVGTRYCANNCSYKVRRFNFYTFADLKTPSLKLGRNPDVTVRTRGVMEKCTYCVQRINSARIDAKKDNRDIRDGEIKTACQQTCPTQAISFGNINDASSEVSKDKNDPLNYGILTDLGTRPRTSYLGRLRNPNPLLEKQDKHKKHGSGH